MARVSRVLLAVVALSTVVAACADANPGVVARGEGSPATTTTVAPTTTQAPATTTSTTLPPTTTTTLPPTTTTTPAPVAPEPVQELAAPLAAPIAPSRPGQSGPNVAALQQRLIDLGFWVDKVDGSYGYVTRQAVMAFQKYWGLPRTQVADQRTVDIMNFVTYRAIGLSYQGDLIEVDKSRQVLFVVRDGKVAWVINVSTGSEKPYTEESKKEPGELLTGDAVTPVGRYKVNRERPEGWWEGELGKLYRPKYFRGGIAVHGASNVPAFPASHGCVRVSVNAMDFIWEQNLMPMGIKVWVRD
ncbi:MAG TPA: L,D-transpeptidase family protein [Acidimicrobiales bacterium]